MTDRQVFNRQPKPFRMMEQDWEFRFIPSIHLKEVLEQVIQLWIKVDVDLVDKTANIKKDEDTQSVFSILTDLITERVYQIIADVLEYQNSHSVTVKDLQMKTSPKEIADFVVLLTKDDELFEAVEALVDAVGKLIDRAMGTQSLMQKYTPSSPTTSDSTTDTSITS